MIQHTLRAAIRIILVALTITSCSKNAADLELRENVLKDPGAKHGDADLQNADFVFSGCRIRQTINQRSAYETLTRNFEYNKDNNPVSVTSNAAGTSQPDLFFKYDKKGNLLEYYGLYSGGATFEFLHRYTYVKERIAVDTMYIFGDYPNPTTYYTKRIRYVRYDDFDRVVADSEVYVYPGPSTNVIHYNYDKNGNLVRYGAAYDSKMSPQRTNKIWMFVDRNYSVNNMVAANTYNASRLPTTFSGDLYAPLMTFAYFYYYRSAEIIYDCSEHGKKFLSGGSD